MSSSSSLAARMRQTMVAYGSTAAEVSCEAGVSLHCLTACLRDSDDAAQAQLQKATGGRLADIHARLERWLTRIASRVQRRSRLASSVPGSALPSPPRARPARRLRPIRLELTVLQDVTAYKLASGVASFSDEFMWDIDSTVDVHEFLLQTVRDLHMDESVWLQPLEDRFRRQIQRYKDEDEQGQQQLARDDADADASMLESKVSHAATDSVSACAADPTPPVEGPAEEPADASDESENDGNNIIKLELDVIHDGVWLQDHVLWDPTHPYSDPDSFARTYVRDVGVAAEFAPKVAWTIRAQLAQREEERTGRMKKRAKVKHWGQSPLLRDATAAAEFTPNVSPLTVRHNIAVLRQAPPPYIAHYTPATHRHALYLGDVIDHSQPAKSEPRAATPPPIIESAMPASPARPQPIPPTPPSPPEVLRIRIPKSVLATIPATAQTPAPIPSTLVPSSPLPTQSLPPSSAASPQTTRATRSSRAFSSAPPAQPPAHESTPESTPPVLFYTFSRRDSSRVYLRKSHTAAKVPVEPSARSMRISRRAAVAAAPTPAPVDENATTHESTNDHTISSEGDALADTGIFEEEDDDDWDDGEADE